MPNVKPDAIFWSDAEYIENWKKKSKIYPDGCWRYLGYCKSDGRAIITYRGVTTNLARVIAHIFYGLDLKSDLQANHTLDCPNRDCWNPDHIYVGTQQDNLRDRYECHSKSNILKVELGESGNLSQDKKNS